MNAKWYKRPKIDDFTFHALRLCVINNLRLVGNDFCQNDVLCGHKTKRDFKRCNVVTEEDRGGIIGENQTGQAEG